MSISVSPDPELVVKVPSMARMSSCCTAWLISVLPASGKCSRHMTLYKLLNIDESAVCHLWGPLWRAEQLGKRWRQCSSLGMITTASCKVSFCVCRSASAHVFLPIMSWISAAYKKVFSCNKYDTELQPHFAFTSDKICTEWQDSLHLSFCRSVSSWMCTCKPVKSELYQMVQMQGVLAYHVTV